MDMTTQTPSRLADLLLLEQRVLDGNFPPTGICFSLGVSSWDETFRGAVRKWKFYSGDTEFPVPGGHKMYTRHRGRGREQYLWDASTIYGMLRRDLLDHLIAFYTELETCK